MENEHHDRIIAEAIAALELAEKLTVVLDEEGYDYNDERRQIKEALSGIRALLPVRSAERNEVIEIVAIAINYARYFPDNTESAPNPLIKSTAAEQWTVEDQSGKSYARKLALASLRSLASAPAESEEYDPAFVKKILDADAQPAEASFNNVNDLIDWLDAPSAPAGQSDSKRLDWLDSVNANINKHYGTRYGWKFDVNHNRASLSDHNIPALSVREAIDEAMARITK